MAKQTICPVCNQKLSFLKQTLEDGTKVCEKHYGEAGITVSEILSRVEDDFTIDEINERIKTSKEAKAESDGFMPTKTIGSVIAFDEVNQLVIISPDKNPRIYDYNSINAYELLEDGETISSGGLGRALAGGVLFGGAGAIVGGVTGKKKNKEKISSLRIKLTINDMNKPVDYIDFLDIKTKKGSILYKDAFNKVQECLSTFQLITDRQDKEKTEDNNSSSSADEIMKFKNLLDAGAITQEEYETKKKELLGL